MKQIGDGKSTGLYTGLSIGYQFANAVLHSLKDHPQATSRDPAGILLPIDERLWQEVFRLEFPNKRPTKDGHIQTLATYCSYYNSGYHGLGYDLAKNFDFGEGQRDREHQLEGQSVAGTDLAVYAGNQPRIAPREVIRLAKELWDGFRASKNRPLSGGGVSGRDLNRDIAELSAALSSEGYFDAKNVEDERRRLLKQVVQRYGQREFRNRLLAAYDGCCAITRCRTKWVLEAAHIVPFAGATTDHVQNGLLLRSDVHTLFDLDLIGLHPTELTVRVSQELQSTDHQYLDGKPLKLPSAKQFRPSIDALQQRWQRFLKANGTLENPE